MSESGGIATTTVGGFTISSNEEKAEDIKANIESEPAPKDGSPEDAADAKDKETKKKRSEAAAELGKAGGKAAAEARQQGIDEQERKAEHQMAKDVEDEAEEEAETKPGHPRHDARARIQQLARERAEERRLRQELEARLAQLEADRAPKVEPQRPGPAGDERPTPDKFETYEDYVDALTEHKMEQRIKKMQAEAEEYQRTQTHVQGVVKRVEAFNERLAKDMDSLTQVDQRLLDLQPSFTMPPGHPPGPANALADEIVFSERPSALMVYLSQHEDEVRRILALPNYREIARAIALIETKLGDAQAEAVVREGVSKAKPPVRPVTPSAQITDEDLDAENTDLDTWIRSRNAQDERRRRGR